MKRPESVSPDLERKSKLPKLEIDFNILSDDDEPMRQVSAPVTFSRQNDELHLQIAELDKQATFNY